MNLSEFYRHFTLCWGIGLVSVVKETIVLICGDHVQYTLLFSTSIQQKEVFQAKGCIVFLFVFFELGFKYREGFLCPDNFLVLTSHTLQNIFFWQNIYIVKRFLQVHSNQHRCNYLMRFRKDSCYSSSSIWSSMRTLIMKRQFQLWNVILNYLIKFLLRLF